jgi:hypothetical protein
MAVTAGHGEMIFMLVDFAMVGALAPSRSRRAPADRVAEGEP